jgi:beta-fructofuranosidase
MLRSWTKASSSSALIAYPPAHLGKLLGWRDPFLLKDRGPAGEHQMIVGSGIEGQGGTVLLYRSADLLSGERRGGRRVTQHFAAITCLCDSFGVS